MRIYVTMISCSDVYICGVLDDGIPRGGVAATGQFLAVFRPVGIVFVVVSLIIIRRQ